jgi:hypothetical protein
MQAYAARTGPQLALEMLRLGIQEALGLTDVAPQLFDGQDTDRELQGAGRNGCRNPRPTSAVDAWR